MNGGNSLIKNFISFLNWSKNSARSWWEPDRLASAARAMPLGCWGGGRIGPCPIQAHYWAAALSAASDRWFGCLGPARNLPPIQVSTRTRRSPFRPGPASSAQPKSVSSGPTPTALARTSPASPQQSCRAVSLASDGATALAASLPGGHQAGLGEGCCIALCSTARVSRAGERLALPVPNHSKADWFSHSARHPSQKGQHAGPQALMVPSQ